MSEPFVGEIRCVGFNYAPVGWELCNGQILQISQNAVLYSLLGIAFGGDGKTTFGLPNLNQVSMPANTLRIVAGATSQFGKTTPFNIPSYYTIPANVVRVILENP